MEQELAGGDKKRSGVASTAATTTGLDGVAQRSLSDGRAQVVALSGVVVASTVVWLGKVNALIAPEGGMAEDGGG